jgi:hypothetical protein
MLRSIAIRVIILSKAVLLISASAGSQNNGVLLREKNPDQAVKEFKVLLDLNEAQEARITIIVNEHFAKRDSLMALYPEQTESDRLSLLVEMRRVWDDTDMLVEAVLEEKQLEKYREFKKKLRKSARESAYESVSEAAIKDMIEKLELTDEQADRAIPILRKSARRRRKVLEYAQQGGMNSRQEMRSHMETIDEETEEQLASILTEEQMKRYREIIEEQRREKREQMRKEGGGRRGRGGRGGGGRGW